MRGCISDPVLCPFDVTCLLGWDEPLDSASDGEEWADGGEALDRGLVLDIR
jgi:hypothetical protein